MTLTDVKTKRWTRDQYYQMADLGWFNGRRVELIDGEIVEMSPQKARHAIAVMIAQKCLEKHFGEGYTVRAQFPLALSDESEPEPDLAVVKGAPRDFPNHPSSALLIVEVAESTRNYDLSEKANLYARFGIQDYWVVDLTRRTLVVHRQPIQDNTAPMGHGYASVALHVSTDSISPLAAPAATVLVADLLP